VWNACVADAQASDLMTAWSGRPRARGGPREACGLVRVFRFSDITMRGFQVSAGSLRAERRPDKECPGMIDRTEAGSARAHVRCKPDREYPSPATG